MCVVFSWNQCDVHKHEWVGLDCFLFHVLLIHRMCSMSAHPSPSPQPSLPAGANPTLSCLAWILIGRLHQMGGRRCRPANGGFSPGAANCWERRRRKGGRPVLSNEELEHPPVGWKVGLSFLGSVSLPLTKHDRMSWLGSPPPKNHHTLGHIRLNSLQI